VTRRARALAVLGAAALAALAAAATATAQPTDDAGAPTPPPATARATSTDTIVAIAAHPTEVTKSILVGPSGQAYERDGDRWLRHHEGGVAADVSGAALLDGDLLVAGVATPLYRRTAGTWSASRLGADGLTTLGSGPTPAVLVRRQVFVLAKGRWQRVGNLPAFKKAFAVWASGPKSVWVSTDQGTYRLKGSDFVRAGDPVDSFAGAAPWGITRDGVRKLPATTKIAATLDGTTGAIVAAAGAGKDLHVAIDLGGRITLARVDGSRLVKIDDLPVTSPVAAMAADAAAVLIAHRDGSVSVRANDAWVTSKVADQLATRAAGPAPSRTR
jgi:hypothetical protein